jgi:hypothetical protein
MSFSTLGLGLGIKKFLVKKVEAKVRLCPGLNDLATIHVDQSIN